MDQNLIIDTLPVIGRLTRTAPLGLRFWDDVTGKVIGDGLVVTAYPPNSPLHRIEASVNHASVYVLTNLPGLREVEYGAGDDSFWRALEATSPPPTTATFKIEVVDSWRRFQPFLLTIDAPVRGIVTSVEGAASSPQESGPGIPLYSTSSRQAPAALAVLRAELREWIPEGDHEGDPARWAVIEARASGRLLARGVADDKGSVALFFAYPQPVTHRLGSPPGVSPPGAEGPSLRDQQWPIEISASFSKLRVSPPFPGAPELPELVEILGQTGATLWSDAEQKEPLTETTLSFGQELILRSADRPTNNSRSVLLISAAGSPP